MLLLSFLAALIIWLYKTWKAQQRLKQLTEFDDLTQVYTRRHFIDLSNQVLRDCQLNGKPVTCIVFDLDHFKNINDTFGHQTGDLVLARVGQECKSICRHNDVQGRLSGEEFSIILPNCQLANGEEIAQKCRQQIADINHKQLGINSPLTASFGVSSNENSGYELTNLLANADTAMYKAKQEGRNCVSIFS